MQTSLRAISCFLIDRISYLLTRYKTGNQADGMGGEGFVVTKEVKEAVQLPLGSCSGGRRRRSIFCS